MIFRAFPVFALLLFQAADSSQSVEDQLWHLRNLGKAFYENPTTQVQAVDEFRKALELRPQSAREQLNYGLALLRAGKTKEGTAQLEKVQKEHPELPHTWFNLGIVLKKDGEFEAARKQFEQFVKLEPNEPVGHYNLGVLLKQGGDSEAAIRELQTAAKLDPNLAAPHFQLYNIYRTSNRAELGVKELETFRTNKKAQESWTQAEDMEWCDYAEIWDPLDMKPPVLVAEQERFDDRTLPGAVDAASAHALAFDADGDMKPDLLVWSSKGALLYRGGSQPVADFGLEKLTDIIAVAPGDYDNDGLMDLAVVQPGGTALWHNEKGKFRRVELEGGAGAYNSALWVDFDHDYDLDLFLFGKESKLLRNQGAAGFADRTADFPFEKGEALEAIPFRLFKDSKSFDIVTSYRDREGVLYHDRLNAHYETMPAKDVAAGAADLQLEYDSTGQSRVGKQAPRLVAADFDNDGRMDRAEVGDTVRLRLNRTDTKHRWMRVQIDGVKNLKLGQGSEVEIKSGTLYQKRMYEGLPLLFDMQGYDAADTVRITWGNGLIQNEPKQATGKAYDYKEAQRLSGSCPMIWTWDGTKFRYITDVLGVAPLGASSGDGTYFPTDHDEYIQIPGDALQAVDGQYEIRVTEELAEVSYLDQIRLYAVDHSAGQEIYTSERWMGPPFADFRFYGVNRRVYPSRAVDHHGHNVLPSLTARDSRYPDDFARLENGKAEPHALTLDFGNVAPENKAVLILNGWVDWADGSTFLSAAQESKDGLVPPYLQVKDAQGQWQTVIQDMGMPDGKPKTIGVDLTGKFLSASREVRIVTNLCVYWDEIFLGESSAAPTVRQVEARTLAADVRFRGFSGKKIDPARKQPEQFFYAVTLPTSNWNPTPGLYTRYGPVGELLSDVDDRFVIMGSGDEVRLRFDANSLPAVAPGQKRDWLLKVDGWAKDRDANTAYSQTVEPLPFHGMSQYPYGAGEHYPEDTIHSDYRNRYNQRPALRLLRPLASAR
jgi:tetratricopeptide (TPR) repeat protein